MLIGLALAGLAGLILYAYLPIRSAANPPLDWGNPENWAGFRSVVGREHWGSLRWTKYSGEFLRLWLLSIDPISELGVPALLLAAVGLAALLLRQRAMAAFLILSPVVYGAWMMIMQAMTGTLNPSLYYITFYGMGEFHIPLYLLLAVAAGVGANRAAERIVAHPRFPRMAPSTAAALGLAAAALCVGPVALLHFPQGNFRHYTQPHAYAARVLDSLEPRSWLFGTGDDPHFAVAYLKFCEGRREDVAILKVREFYLDELDEAGRARGGLLSARDFVEKMSGATNRYIEPRYHQEIPLDPERTAVYFTILPLQPTIASNLYPRGLVFRLGDRAEYSME